MILAREKEENIARQGSPITQEMFTALLEQAKSSQIDSDVSVIANRFTQIRLTGFRCSEYGQTTQSVFDEYKHLSGKHVIKAFIPTDWIFFDARGRLIGIHTQVRHRSA